MTQPNQIMTAFQSELSLTEQDLALLQDQKKDLILERTSDGEGLTDAAFKAGKADKRECKKITDGIARLAIDTKKGIDDQRKDLIARVDDIYKCVIDQVSDEDKRRKEIAKEKERLKQIEAQRIDNAIEAIRNMRHNADERDLDSIQECIDQVSNFPLGKDYGSRTAEAYEAQQETITSLTAMYSAEKNRRHEEMVRKKMEEKARVEREALERKAKEQEAELERIKVEQRKIADLNNEIQSIRNLSNAHFNSCSETIQFAIDELGGQNVDQDHFGDLYQDAVTAKNQVTDQLIALKNQKVQAEIAEHKQNVESSINQMSTYSNGYHNKSSAEISEAIKYLENYELDEDFYGDLLDQASAAKDLSLDQLSFFHGAKLAQEQQEADRIKAEKEAEQKRIEEEKARIARQQQAERQALIGKKVVYTYTIVEVNEITVQREVDALMSESEALEYCRNHPSNLSMAEIKKLKEKVTDVSIKDFGLAK